MQDGQFSSNPLVRTPCRHGLAANRLLERGVLDLDIQSPHTISMNPLGRRPLRVVNQLCMVINCIESRCDKLHVRNVFSNIADALLILCSSYKASYCP